MHFGSLNLILVLAILSIGCSSSTTTPPTNLPKPPPSAFAAVDAAKLEVQNLVATIELPKGNPTKDGLTYTADDNALLNNLPPLKCKLEFGVNSDTASRAQFNFGVTVSVFERGYHVVHAQGQGVAIRSEKGTFIAEIELRQSRPIEPDNEASVTLRLIGVGQRSATGVARADFGGGEVIIMREE